MMPMLALAEMRGGVLWESDSRQLVSPRRLAHSLRFGLLTNQS
jgi:hypothetical protein